MNKILLGALLSYSLLAQQTSAADTTLTQIWQSKALFSAPESVVYAPKHAALFVSNYNNEGGFKRTDKGQANEFISKLDLNGHVVNRKWLTKLENPTGMAVFKDKLYIVERGGVVIANIDTQTIEQCIAISGAKFLNDIVVSPEGTVYVSDSGHSVIYRIQEGQAEQWLRHALINSPNGLWLDGNQLLVGNKGEGNLLAVSLFDKTSHILGSGISAKIDGLKRYGSGYLLSWKNTLYLLQDGDKTVLYRLENKKDFFADFEYIPSKNLLIVPQLVSGKVMALKIAPP